VGMHEDAEARLGKLGLAFECHLAYDGMLLEGFQNSC